MVPVSEQLPSVTYSFILIHILRYLIDFEFICRWYQIDEFGRIKYVSDFVNSNSVVDTLNAWFDIAGRPRA
jgi:hypothetical protein